ncbi:MAG: hypothetical protein LBT46_15225 [Planctomycetaceae bacterium]|jgi:hypothetical protein|nr:hypothetical protein [Planctomycetaceae bacterium]
MRELHGYEGETTPIMRFAEEAYGVKPGTNPRTISNKVTQISSFKPKDAFDTDIVPVKGNHPEYNQVYPLETRDVSRLNQQISSKSNEINAVKHQMPDYRGLPGEGTFLDKQVSTQKTSGPKMLNPVNPGISNDQSNSD